jgi:glutaredoxin
MPKVELYGTKSCPYTEDARNWLEWNQRDFVEYNVDSDREALDRMLAITAGQRTIPVLIEDGKVTQVGWQGRGCVV